MRKLIAALLLVVGLILFGGQGQALAQSATAPECIKVMSQGSKTVEAGWFTQPTPTLAWSQGVITTDVKYNVCVPTAVIRINGTDWTRLMAEGKLDGLRYEVYQYAEKDGNYQNFLFRKVQGTAPTTITATQFAE